MSSRQQLLNGIMLWRRSSPSWKNAETLLPLLEARFRADGRDDVPAQQKLEEIQQSLKTVLLRVVMKDSDNNLMKLGFIYIYIYRCF